MKLTRETIADRPIVQRYGGGTFKVSGTVYSGSIIVLPNQVLAWPVSLFSDVTLESLAPVVALAKSLDVCLIGCGANMAPLPAALRGALKDAGLAADSMATASACRTYNLLVGEGRAVAAALIVL